MHPSIRAARDAEAMGTILAAADRLGDRFGVPFDAAAVTRHARDPQVKGLFQREALAAFLSELEAATAPGEALPDAGSVNAAMNVRELSELIAAAEDAATLDRIEEAERAGEHRVTVLRAIERRRGQLAEAEAEPFEDDGEAPAFIEADGAEGESEPEE